MAKARKEIDKESMYQKIMPSSIRATQAAETEPEVKPRAPKKPAAPRPPRKAPAAGARTTAKAVPPLSMVDETEPEDYSVAEAVASTRKAAHQTPPAAPEDSAIVNVMELLIDDKLDAAIEKFHCCNCARCRQDIAAFALNKLNPKYIVSEPDALALAMADKEYNTQVTTALVQAILKIKANPNH